VKRQSESRAPFWWALRWTGALAQGCRMLLRVVFRCRSSSGSMGAAQRLRRAPRFVNCRARCCGLASPHEGTRPPSSLARRVGQHPERGRVRRFDRLAQSGDRITGPDQIRARPRGTTRWQGLATHFPRSGGNFVQPRLSCPATSGLRPVAAPFPRRSPLVASLALRTDACAPRLGNRRIICRGSSVFRDRSIVYYGPITTSRTVWAPFAPDQQDLGNGGRHAAGKPSDTAALVKRPPVDSADFWTRFDHLEQPNTRPRVPDHIVSGPIQLLRGGRVDGPGCIALFSI